MESQASAPAGVLAPTDSAVDPPAAAARGASPGVLLAVFTASIFLSAFLLFLVQPMFSRMVLPLLGGTPAVWNTCMLFFQAALLGGYLYAHATARWLGVRSQAALHLALLAVAAAVLPVAVAGAAPRGGQAPIPWLLVLMLGTVGAPFFVLSGTGPMLQRWFAHSGHADAHNPYFLYAASNLGSMLALLSYPLWVERALRLWEQSRAWTAGYAVLALGIAACAGAVWRAPGVAGGPSEVSTSMDAAGARPVTGRERVQWVLLAFVPSGLLLSVTTFITTDIAPVPFLWVLPLALYLLTFTLAFARRPPLRHEWMVKVQPTFVLAVVLLMVFGFSRNPAWVVPLHLSAFFVTAMVCHGELARRRPGARHLTEFYLWVSVGGVLGGIFNVLLAPLLFPRMEEYSLLLAAACRFRPAAAPADRRTARNLTLSMAPVVAGGLLLMMHPELLHLPAAWDHWVAATMIAIGCLALARFPSPFAACVAAALLTRIYAEYRDNDFLLVHRSFYGRYAVLNEAGGGGYHTLYHGSTLHGAQSLDPARRREPLTYYVRGGPLGRLFAGLPAPAHPRRVAVVGLGSGTSSAYGQPGEEWTYYEIDPGIERIARDPRYFTYLADSPARVRVVLGDARLSLAQAPEGAYDLIILDAFSSDAVPIHLLTSEALGVYLRRLAPGGTIVYHLSNRYLNLEPVIGALARERGLTARVASLDKATRAHEAESTWAAVARRPGDLGVLAADTAWKPAKTRASVPAWTDDFSNLVSVFGRWK
jgi:predicted O-methyltransferase YrrM